MKQWMKKRKMKGFTLVELLIVIIIIGILAGALLLVAGAGTDKANATKVVSNLRNGKAAMLMAYADFNEWVDDTTELDSLDAYMEATFDAADFVIAESNDAIWLGFSGDIMTKGVRDKLVLMAEDTGLVNGTDNSTYDGNGACYMQIIE